MARFFSTLKNERVFRTSTRRGVKPVQESLTTLTPLCPQGLVELSVSLGCDLFTAIYIA